MAGSNWPSALKNITPRSPYSFARLIFASADWESLKDTKSVFVAFVGSGVTGGAIACGFVDDTYDVRIAGMPETYVDV